MIFWIGILIGGLFAWLAVKMGFYWAWATLFNVVISVYLAIFLGPIIPDLVAGADTAYGDVLGMICIAIAAFLILHSISCAVLTGHLRFSCPRLIDSLGGMVLGFLAGFLAWSFIGLLLYMTPFAQNEFVKVIGFGGQSQQTTLANIGWWCDLVNGAAGSEGSAVTSKEIIEDLLKKTQQRRQEEMEKEADPNKPTPAETKTE